MARAVGIEPTVPLLESGGLPLTDARIKIVKFLLSKTAFLSLLFFRNIEH